VSEVLETWPEVPLEQRAAGPRPIYVAEYVQPSLKDELESKGWRVVDVRLLSGREAALGKLEGVTTGSIKPPANANWQRALELELRVHKLLSDRTEAPKEEKPVLSGADEIDALLSFGRSEVTNVPALITSPTPLAPLPEKKKGRPKGSKDLKPRKSTGILRGIALKKALEKREKQLVEAIPPVLTKTSVKEEIK
jgi:hypothetical protein